MTKRDFKAGTIKTLDPIGLASLRKLKTFSYEGIDRKRVAIEKDEMLDYLGSADGFAHLAKGTVVIKTPISNLKKVDIRETWDTDNYRNDYASSIDSILNMMSQEQKEPMLSDVISEDNINNLLKFINS